MSASVFPANEATLTARDPAVFTVAFVLPLRGPAGIYGPSCDVAGQLAAEEINARNGILGREVRLLRVDGGQHPDAVAAEVDALVSYGIVDAVIGWHISAVRQAIVRKVAGRVPYIYTALYEGGERSPGVFVSGETPADQLLPALRWMAHELGVRSWCIVGNDYVWPRRTASIARRYAAACNVTIHDEIYVELGTEDFSPVLNRLEHSGADAVLMLLVGQDAVLFNRAFAERGLHATMRRFSTIVEENVLLATGAEATRDLYAAAGYFGALPTDDSLDFVGRMSARFGPDCPANNSLGESCYEGMQLLSHLVAAAGDRDVRSMMRAADGARYEGPRGPVYVEGNHLRQSVYLAAASGLDFDVVTQLTAP